MATRTETKTQRAAGKIAVRTKTKVAADTTTKKASPPKKEAATSNTAGKKPAAKAITKSKPTTAANTSAKRKAAAAQPNGTAKKQKVAATTDDKKRKTPDEDDAAPAPTSKKVKTAAKGAIITEPPTDRLKVFVFGEGTAGELGLGTAKKAVDVKRPRLNPNLDPQAVGVTQVEAGGMHVIALTHDNKVLTWGVNDQGALGRDTEWDGGFKDMDAAMKESDGSDSEEEEDDNGLNPKECVPGAVDWSSVELPEGTRFVDVTAGDSCSFALTDDGHVYGCGTFRGNEGVFGFAQDVEIAKRPILIAGLKNIVSIKAGANHALALDSNGAVFAWGSGQQMQLGRRVVERTKLGGLQPREFGLPKGKKTHIVAIGTGGYHSFAIANNGDVYSWGLNSFGQTGHTAGAGDDEAVILKPTVIESLRGKPVVSLHGGSHHSVAATADGECLIWGRVDGRQMGMSTSTINDLPEDTVIRDDKNEPRIISVPTAIPTIDGKVTVVAAMSDHNVVVTEAGRAYSWGFSANYQTGQGTIDDIVEATMIDNTAVRDTVLTGATAGGQFSIVTAKVTN
nr:hypothetical protein B0A51_00244 [Rachicladosporium sp. CCFEE 5018]